MDPTACDVFYGNRKGIQEKTKAGNTHFIQETTINIYTHNIWQLQIRIFNGRPPIWKCGQNNSSKGFGERILTGDLISNDELQWHSLAAALR